MKHLIKRTALVRLQIEQTLGYTPAFPAMLRAEQILIPHLEWFGKEWMPWWNRYRARRNVTNIRGRTCDQYSQRARIEMNEVALERQTRVDIDANIACFEARIFIKNRRFMDVYRGNHFTTLIGYCTDESIAEDRFHLALWEPQQSFNKPFTYENLETARTDIDFSDVDL